jgi:hypothetical protein
MPGYNRSGPQGNGPMSGRRLGRCRILPVPAQGPVTTARPVYYENEAALAQGFVLDSPVYGRVRGGIRCGREQDFGFGGGRCARR